METFPAFYPLQGRRVVVAGEGEPAEIKARLFAGSPATVVRLIGDAALDPQAYAGADLIFVASFDVDFLKAASAAARTAGAPLNVVDRPEHSDFYTPAIIDRGQVVAAIGTAGAAPLMASLLRAEIEMRIPQGAGQIAALLGEQRETLRAAFPDLAHRRAFLRAALTGPAADAAAAGNVDLASRRLAEAIAQGWSAVGRVTFIAVPEQADLISLRAARALNIADIAVAGPDAAEILAAHLRRDAERIAPPGPNAAALAEQARTGRLIVVVSAKPDRDLADTLAQSGVAVEVLRAAPAPVSDAVGQSLIRRRDVAAR